MKTRMTIPFNPQVAILPSAFSMFPLKNSRWHTETNGKKKKNKIEIKQKHSHPASARKEYPDETLKKERKKIQRTL